MKNHDEDQYRLQNCPENFDTLVIETQNKSGHTKDELWRYLSKKSTFQKGQVFPYRVEFLNENPSELYFKKQDYHNHHGPFLSANGIVSEMIPTSYRRLDYFYGSYGISFRLFRPVSLEFWIDEDQEKTLIKSRFVFYVSKRVPQAIIKLMRLIWKLGSSNLTQI